MVAMIVPIPYAMPGSAANKTRKAMTPLISGELSSPPSSPLSIPFCGTSASATKRVSTANVMVAARKPLFSF